MSPAREGGGEEGRRRLRGGMCETKAWLEGRTEGAFRLKVDGEMVR